MWYGNVEDLYWGFGFGFVRLPVWMAPTTDTFQMTIEERTVCNRLEDSGLLVWHKCTYLML